VAIKDILFQPEHIDAMHAAFVAACARLRLRVGSIESDRLALRIVDLAEAGERDARTLASLALLSEMKEPAR
jgi:hypothetical protein